MHFSRIIRRPLATQRVSTLVEASLFAAILLTLVVSGLIFFEQVRDRANMNTVSQSTILAQAEIRDFLSGPDGSEVEKGDMSQLIKARSIAGFESLQGDSGGLRHPWGGSVSFIYEGERVFWLSFDDIPSKACQRLAAETFHVSLFNLFRPSYSFQVDGVGFDIMDETHLQAAVDACQARPNVSAGWLYAPTRVALSKHLHTGNPADA